EGGAAVAAWGGGAAPHKWSAAGLMSWRGAAPTSPCAMLVVAVRSVLPPAGMVALSNWQSKAPVPPPVGVQTKGGAKLRLARSKPASSVMSKGPLKSPWPTFLTVMVKGHCTV